MPQAESQPVVEKLHAFMTEQLQHKHVESNSDIGKAYAYMLTRWDKLTLFLRKAGAPLENKVCERALKMAICHRRNSLFYRSQREVIAKATRSEIRVSCELDHEVGVSGARPTPLMLRMTRANRAQEKLGSLWLTHLLQA